jgi:gliding motility-associated-like protein
MKRILLLVVGLMALYVANAQVQTINTNLYRYSPDLTDKQYFDIDRINYMPKEDWAAYSSDPRFDADKIVAMRTAWKQNNNRPGQLKTTAAEAACHWINPDNSYVHPNPIQWPGSPGNSTDNYSGVINLGWDFNFFGQNFNQVVITTKGTIALGNAGYIDYLPSSFPTPLGTDHICALWSDYDFGATGELYYKVTSNALYLNYIDVGYWPTQGDKTNSFQIIICEDGSGVLPDGNNVQFVYLDMQWANSQISGATGGFNAASNIAIVGADRVSGNGAYTFGRFNLDNDVYNGPFGINANQQDGVDWLDGRIITFNTSISNLNNNIPPVPIEDATLCDTTYLCQGEFAEFEFAYTAPESNQNVTLTSSVVGSGFSSTVQSLTNSAQLVDAIFTAGPNNIGTNVVTLTGVDNGTPNETTAISYVFVVTADVAQPIEITGNTAFCAGSETILTATPGFDSYLWTNGETDNVAEIDDDGTVTVIGFANGCESVTSIDLVESGLFIPELESDNMPIILCPGETADVCLVQDWPVIEWFVFPGYDGEFAPGASTDAQCTTVTGNIQGNYGVLVTDSTGCQGQNIQLVQVTNNYIDEANEANNGSYCDELTPVTFTGGYTNPAADNLVVYGLSTNTAGWQGSYINITIFPAGGGTPETTFLTTFNTFTLFDDILIGVGDSIVIEYFANGNNYQGNSLWVINCGQNTPTIVPAPLTTGVVYSALSTCTSEPLTGVWTVTGPAGWDFSNDGFYDGTFTPGDYGVYELCFSAPDCSTDHCYDLIYTSTPEIGTAQSDITLCNQESIVAEAFLDDPVGTSTVSWSGEGVVASSDGLSANVGPYGMAYVNTTVTVTATNGCGSDSDSFNVVYQPQLPLGNLNGAQVCPGGTTLLDPIPSAQDNNNITYLWTPGGQTTSTIMAAEGNYTVTFDNLCDDPTTLTVNVTEAVGPTITDSPDPSVLECNNDQVTLTVAYSNPNNYSVTWNGQAGDNTLEVSNDGTYCWEVEDNAGCNLTVSGCVEVDISAAPTVGGGSNTLMELCPGECEDLNLAANGENVSYAWTSNCNGYSISNGGDNAAFCADNVPLACMGSTIVMTGTASNGCGSASATFVLMPDACAIRIPNVVSPNSDGLNDTFYMEGLEKYEDVKLYIYNRWGKLVFETVNYDNNYQPTDLPDGVYFYTMQLPYGNQTEVEGTLHVMR